MTGSPREVLGGFLERGRRAQVAVDETIARERMRLDEAAALVLDRLRDVFPGAFVAEGAPKHSLKVGIVDDLIAKAPGLAPDLLREAVRLYTNNPSYMIAVVDGAPRVDLDGRPASRVAPSEANRATASLRRFDQPLLEAALQRIAAGNADPAATARAALDEVAKLREARKKAS